MTSPIERLRKIVVQLRSPDGCPWDREQTHQSLKPHLVEECYELIDAIDAGNDKELKEELGDLLLQVVLHSQMAAEASRFTLDEVATAIADKLVNRHPHVFGENRLPNSEAVLRQWEVIKRSEKQERRSVLDGVPKGLPALARAQKVQTKAARVGFDWDEADGALAKVREELQEVESAVGGSSSGGGRRSALCRGKFCPQKEARRRATPQRGEREVRRSVPRDGTACAGARTGIWLP